jgi:hypothetical protein
MPSSSRVVAWAWVGTAAAAFATSTAWATPPLDTAGPRSEVRPRLDTQAPAPAPESAPESAPAPAVRPVLRPSKALIAGGGALFATLYLASSLAASDGYDTPDGSSNPRWSLWIPGAGPFIMLGQANSAIADVFLVLDGLGQLGGLTALVYGIATPKTVLVPADTSTAKAHVVPLLGGGMSGAALVGSF